MAPPNTLRRLLGLFLVVVLVATGCSGDDEASAERGLSGPRPAPTIAGQSVDGFAPGVDDRVAIVGVAMGETLSLRALPGVDQPVVVEIPGTAEGLFGFGEAHLSPDDRLWWLVRFEDAQGWIEPGAAYLGTATDVSVGVAGRLQSTTYDSFDDLADDVRSQYSDAAVVVSQTDETAAGPASLTLDVLQDGDDSVAGVRVNVSASSANGGYRLASAEEVPLCIRGVTVDGLCR